MLAVLTRGPGLLDYWESEEDFEDVTDEISAYLEDMRRRMIPMSVHRRGNQFEILMLDFVSKKWRQYVVAARKDRL